MMLNVCFTVPEDYLCIDFNMRLHWRGSDFRVYANTGFTSVNQPEPKTTVEKLGRTALAGMVEIDQHILKPDSKLMQAVLTALMQDDTGVAQVQVETYRLVIQHSLAVQPDDIRKLVLNALTTAGIDFVELDQYGQPFAVDRPSFWRRYWASLTGAPRPWLKG